MTSKTMRAIMESNGISNADAAKYLKISISYVTKLRNGKREITEELCQSIWQMAIYYQSKKHEKIMEAMRAV